MVEYKRIKREDEKLKKESRYQKKAPRSLYNWRNQAPEVEDGQARQILGRVTAHQASLVQNPQIQSSQRAKTMLELQQSYGNRYVQQLVGKIQPKLIVNPPDDGYERQADRVAYAVIRAPASNVQRQVEEEEKEEEEPVVEVRTKMSRIQRQITEPKEGEKEEEIVIKHSAKVEHSTEPVLQRQKDIPGGPEKPPKTTSDPKEVAAKVLEAASKTELGKKFTKKLINAATSKEGVAVISTLAVPALTVAFAEKMEVPQGLVGLVPKIAKFEVGKNVEVSFQPIYKGKFGEKPKDWGGMVYLTVKRW